MISVDVETLRIKDPPNSWGEWATRHTGGSNVNLFVAVAAGLNKVLNK